MAVCEFTASGELQSQHEKLNASLEQLLSSLERKQDRLSKLVDLYNEIIEERSKKVGELEAVIKALQIHSSQIESDYKEKLDNEISAKKELEKVLYEIEEKTPLILVLLDERVKHKRLMEAYSAANQKLQHSQSEQTSLQKTILDLKVDLRRRERDFDVSQKQVFDLQKQVKSLEEDLAKLRMERDKMGLEANFAEELSRKLSMEVKSLEEDLAKLRMERDGLEANFAEELSRKLSMEKEWAEAKKDLQQERDSARTLRLESEDSLRSAMKQVEEMGKELSDALHAVATAELKAAVAEARLSYLEKTSQALASLQKEASDLRNVANLLKAEERERLDKMARHLVGLEEEPL